MESQDSYLDDDVLALLSDSDSDILETVEKTNFVDFLNDDSSMLAGFDKIFIKPQKLTFSKKLQKGTSVF